MRRVHPTRAAHRDAEAARRDLPDDPGPLFERLAPMRLHEVPLEPWEDVHDPAGGDLDVFLECAREIADLLHELIPRWRRDAGRPRRRWSRRDTALVLQEVQNGVVGSPSALPALADAAAAVDLVANSALLARRARRGCARDALHGRDRDDMRGANHNARLFPALEGAGTVDARHRRGQVPDEIGVDPGDSCCPGTTARPMTGTQLDSVLRNLGVTTIVGVGVSVNVGMTNLAFDAVNRGYQIVMPPTRSRASRPTTRRR